MFRAVAFLSVCLLSGCFALMHEVDSMNAVNLYRNQGVTPACGFFHEGMQFPDGSVVDQVDQNVVVVIIPDPRSAEGEDDHAIPCR